MRIGLAATIVASFLMLAAPLGALAQERMQGSIQSVDGTTVWLSGGSSFGLSASTRIVETRPATAADLTSGQYAAITATRQDDGSLLASIISVFPESSRGSFEGQRPLDGDNVMTNAFIDSARIDFASDALVEISFLGSSEVVRIAPDAAILLRLEGVPADVKPGMGATATVVDGVASSLNLQ
jgi:hypothetical protein